MKKRKGGQTVETGSGDDTTHIVFVWHGWMRGIYHAFSDETDSEYRKPVRSGHLRRTDVLCCIDAQDPSMDAHFLAENSRKDRTGHFGCRVRCGAGAGRRDDFPHGQSSIRQATVVVLGCKAYGERPSLTLEERLRAAIRYLNANPGAACVVSGGQGADETLSEAQCMYLYLVNHGIAPERIYREDQSTTTRENIAFSYEIIKEHGLNEKLAIATNNYHEYRAGMIADDLGLEHGAVPGSTALWLLPTYYARELLAILYEWIF